MARHGNPHGVPWYTMGFHGTVMLLHSNAMAMGGAFMALPCVFIAATSMTCFLSLHGISNDISHVGLVRRFIEL